MVRSRAGDDCASLADAAPASRPGAPARAGPPLAEIHVASPSAVLASAASWLATVAACVGIALATGAELPGLRTLMPYIGWLVMAPLVGWWADRFPALGRRNLVIHLLSAPLAVALHQLTFRALLFAATGVWESPPRTPGYLFTGLWIGLLLYVSTVWPVTALGSLARAQRAELRQAELESETLSADLDLTLSRLGPEELDVMIGRVRALTRTSAAAADDAIDALGQVPAAGPARRRGREMDAAARDRPGPGLPRLRGGLQRPGPRAAPAPGELGRLERMVRQHVLVAAAADLVAGTGGPLRLEVADAPGALTLRTFAVDGAEPLQTVRVAG